MSEDDVPLPPTSPAHVKNKYDMVIKKIKVTVNVPTRSYGLKSPESQHQAMQ